MEISDWTSFVDAIRYGNLSSDDLAKYLAQVSIPLSKLPAQEGMVSGMHMGNGTILGDDGYKYKWDPLKRTYIAISGPYASGGLADFTGPAWLDGTKARPEYVLNAAQTQGFLSLVDILDNFDAHKTSKGSGDNYYDVHIEVDEISNDYDVEQLMDKMKRIIADDAMYRNVNAVDLGRR